MSATSGFEIKEGIQVPIMSADRWQKLIKFPVRPDDVFIATFPRSGTTWTQHIVRLLRNRKHDREENLDDIIPWLDALGSDVGDMMKFNPHAADALESPRAFKVHMPYTCFPGGAPHTTSAKYIYVARNPKDVCVSFWHFYQSQVQKFDDNAATYPWDMLYSDFVGHTSGPASVVYGGWMNHVLEWWKHRDEPNILFLKYEDMKKDLCQTVQSIAEFIGVENITQQQVEDVVAESSFSSMSRDATVNARIKEGASVNFKYMRKGIVGDWKNHFTAEQNEDFEEKIIKPVREKGLDFEYD